jgi:hypothetical protein
MNWWNVDPLSQQDRETGVRKAHGSHFLNSSYSGADIKVVVSLPVNSIALKTELANIDGQIADIDRRLGVERSLSEEVVRDGGTYDLVNLITLSEQKETLQRRRGELEKMANVEGSIIGKALATLQTISWSIYREKTPVRFLGSTYARSYVRGPRTIAGSMIFTMFDRHALQDILNWGLSPYSTGHVEADHDYYRDTTMLIDQLPPLDMTILFANEYGSTSYMNLWGVEFLSEGGTFSVEDLFSESVVQYIARDIDPIRADIKRETDVFTNTLSGAIKPKTASQLRLEEVALPGNAATEKKRNPYL